ncbi:hypothetical protein H2248_011185 [Termitomyces sp. 'cryptogamus']|nr:hypothetical protein H2248_011185 [Termitomyces sp. 'cryptogamus']
MTTTFHVLKKHDRVWSYGSGGTSFRWMARSSLVEHTTLSVPQMNRHKFDFQEEEWRYPFETNT